MPPAHESRDCASARIANASTICVCTEINARKHFAMPVHKNAMKKLFCCSAALMRRTKRLRRLRKKDERGSAASGHQFTSFAKNGRRVTASRQSTCSYTDFNSFSESRKCSCFRVEDMQLCANAHRIQTSFALLWLSVSVS